MVQREVHDAEWTLAEATGDLDFAQTRADPQGEPTVAGTCGLVGADAIVCAVDVSAVLRARMTVP